jgi:hypothetical protein
MATYGIGAAGWWNLPTNADLSAKYQSIITPAGWAFSIWGIIFMSQLVWTLWQQPVLRRLDDDRTHILPPMVKAVGLDYLYVCLAQIGWTAAFTTEHIFLSLIFMIMILTFLLLILNNLRQLDCQDSYFIYQFPFSIHAAWILAAVAVSVNVVMVWAEASSWSQFTVGAASLLVLLTEALLRTYHHGGDVRRGIDWTFPIVLMWALAGVYSELSSPKPVIVDRFSQQEISIVRFGAVGGIAVLVLAALLQALRLFLSRQRQSDSFATSEEATRLRSEGSRAQAE